MEYLITALDGKDNEALSRRLSARADHIKLGDKMILEGSLLYAAAILNEQEQMIGSCMVVSFSSEDELHAWLKVEPYVVQNVWKEIDIKKCRPGPAFVKTV